jgi:hypothetical protein
VGNFALLGVKSSVANRGRAITPLAAVTRLLSLVLLVFLALSSGAHAQLYTGSVTGVVTDPSGATVPSAKITLVDQNKGYSFTAATDSATGRYLLRSIPPGTYKITVEAPNFQGQTREGIALDVSQNVSVDFSLKVGTASEIVEVKSSGVQLQTEDAVTGQVVNRKFVNDLPLNDRNFMDLTFLAPGVTETNAPGSSGGVNFNSNGGRNSTADVLIDGATVTNFEQNSGLQTVPYEPSVDSVEEFKVQQNNFTAEYGFAGGTILNVVTRSGTNQFHGTAYEFLRNSATDANEWFANKNGNPIPPLKKNNFGGVIGGPIRKDKTFFFFNYEGRRDRSFASQTLGVPTLCERGAGPCPVGPSVLGNFSEICTGNGGSFPTSGPNAGQCVDSTGALLQAGQLYDPYTGVSNNGGALRCSNGNASSCTPGFIPFNNLASYTSPGNPNLVGTPFQLPAGPGNLIDPVARNFIGLFPMPTIISSDLNVNQNSNFARSGVSGGSRDQFDIKLDHRFSDHDLLSVKYSQERENDTSFNAFQNEADPFTSGPTHSTRHLLAINHTHTFSPTLVLTLTYGGLRAYDNTKGIGGEFPNIDATFSKIGFAPYLNRGFKILPGAGIGGNYGNTTIGAPGFSSILRWGQETHQLGGAVSWVRGKHELKFGGEGRMHRINFIQPGQPSGFFNFDNTGTSQDTTTNSGGDALASFLIGVGSNGNISGFNNSVSTQSFRYAAFAQDNFRVTPKLTLNLGLRYELSLPRTERFNRMNWLDPNAVSPMQLSAAQLAQVQTLGLPAQAVQTLSNLHGTVVFTSPSDRNNYYADYKAIQPRFGFAYQLPHAFVVRGGYGIYFSTPRSGASGTGPWGFEGFNIQPSWNTTLPDGATPFNTFKNPSCFRTPPFTCADVLPPGNSLGAFTDIGASTAGPIRSVSQNIPYEQTWSLGFQKDLPGKILFDASYVGKKGTHLYLGGFREHNFLPPSALKLTQAQLQALNTKVNNPFFDPVPNDPACDRTRFICDPAASLSGSQTSLAQLMVPFPQYTSFAGDSPPIANSIYHALQVRAEKDFSHGLQFLVTYTWSKSIDDASATDDSFSFLGGGTPGGSTLTVQNPYNLRAERAVSVYDIPQIFQASYVYEFPLGRGKQFGGHMNSILNAVVGGWQTNGIIRVDTGRPIIPLISGAINAQSIPTFGQRPNLTGNLGRSSGSPQDFTDLTNNASYFANPNALSHISADNAGLHDDFTLGNAPRTISNVRQPGARDVSMSLFKEFALGKVREGMHLEFRAESFNTFNHPHFQGPNASVGSSNFGKIESTVNSPRELQFGLKLYF